MKEKTKFYRWWLGRTREKSEGLRPAIVNSVSLSKAWEENFVVLIQQWMNKPTNLVNYKLLTIFSQLESEELAPKTRIKHTSDLTYNCSNWYEQERSAE